MAEGTRSLNAASLERLSHVHKDLQAVVHLAYDFAVREGDDFIVTEGLRTVERQRELFRKGASKTMNSRHLTGHAVDLAYTHDGHVLWDWPLYYKLSAHMKRAATLLHVPLVWGGDWKTFKDGPHFELDRSIYP